METQHSPCHVVRCIQCTIRMSGGHGIDVDSIKCHQQTPVVRAKYETVQRWPYIYLRRMPGYDEVDRLR